ncbi:hypothetical protein F4778DRAFT_155924 [Xylariomycetidae sp. FL2044]|nr:hypothetical protein F4778DRAFT_155924 [Xylariomycetidae sp. FL2044]
MAGPRLTAPASKLARSMSTTSVPKPTTLLNTSKTAAPLSRKYAELLRERNLDGEHPRHLTTRSSSNRPHPPPRNPRLMQTFATSVPRDTAASSSRSMDRMVFPGNAGLEAGGAASDPYAGLRVPLLPDSFLARNAPEAADGPLATPEISIVAANPDVVAPAALTEVEGMGVDGIELKFVHERARSDESSSSSSAGMLKGIWNGLNDAVLGSDRNKSNLVL